MEDLNKVNSTQLYLFWRNLSISLLALVAVLAFSKLFPFYLSPVISLVITAVLYTLLYNNKMSEQMSCVVTPYAIFFCLIVYSFVTIIINILWVWGIIPHYSIPKEMIFFNMPFLPSLYLLPCSFITMLVIYIRRHKLKICQDCKLENASNFERGKSGLLYKYESSFQLRNLTILFLILSILIWGYYIFVYNNIDVNARDWYIFSWLVIIFFIIDEVYFIFRYYNLYLDLKENDEIVTDDEIRDMTAKTYIRFLVCCGNNTFINTKAVDPNQPFREVIDTPFFTKRSVNGVTVDEVRKIIEDMTGYKGGELRFFYGRKSSDFDKHSILRYFYFLDGDISQYQNMNVAGEWIDFDKFKQIYARTPGKLSSLTLADISRLATIMLTEKIFDDNGYRKNKLKTYRPNFTLPEVRKSDLDFQDDKWIRISSFNSDTPFYTLKRWWNRIRGKKVANNPTWAKRS